MALRILLIVFILIVLSPLVFFIIQMIRKTNKVDQQLKSNKPNLTKEEMLELRAKEKEQKAKEKEELRASMAAKKAEWKEEDLAFDTRQKEIVAEAKAKLEESLKHFKN